METSLKPLSQAFSPVATVSDQLEVGDALLNPDDWLDLSVFGYWIAGQVKVDPGGWYLLTRDQVGIRLRAGLRVRLREDPFRSPSPSTGVLFLKSVKRKKHPTATPMGASGR